MKHVKLFEDFSSSNYGGNKNSSNLVITVYDKMDADKLVAKANEFGFPILSSPNVAATYLRSGNIWSIENGSDLYFYQPSVDAERPITTPSNKRISLADFCSEVGCTENEILSRTEGSAGEIKSGFILLSGSDNGFNISHVGNENELRELTSKLKSISYVDVYPPLKDNGEKLAYTYDGDDFRQYKSPKDVDYEFFINEDGEIIEDAGNGEGYLWEIPEIGFTLVGQPGGFFSKVSNSQFANKL